jgi:hypothetical protein
MLAPMAMPATLSPFIAEISHHQPDGADGQPPRSGPIQTWNIL